MGANICLADFVFFEMIELMLFISLEIAFQMYTTLQAYHGRIKNLPNMKKFLESAHNKSLPFFPKDSII